MVRRRMLARGESSSSGLSDGISVSHTWYRGESQPGIAAVTIPPSKTINAIAYADRASALNRDSPAPMAMAKRRAKKKQNLPILWRQPKGQERRCNSGNPQVVSRSVSARSKRDR